eukprot:69935_1
MISSYQYIRYPCPVQYFVYNLNPLKCAITCHLNLSTVVTRVIPISTESHDFTSNSFGAYHIHHQCVSVISTFFLVIILNSLGITHSIGSSLHLINVSHIHYLSHLILSDTNPVLHCT